MNVRLHWLILSITLLIGGCTAPSFLTGDDAIDPAEVPDTPREFRAVWIATVANIDWPFEPELSSDEQKAELRKILDRAVLLNMNAVILQVRPAADALYHSSHEPWSEFLTGEPGKAPDPWYDPLEFAVEEAHRRGLELHAWFNPFRAYHPSAEKEPASDHISRTDSSLVLEYGTSLWLDPGREEARSHSLDVILDVVSRYDIDGVHLDDYFYPYAELDEEENEIDFPDSTSFRDYQEKGGDLGRSDWRRQNVNRFVEQLQHEIKEIDPTVRFGISPFGIWRPGYPEQIDGYDAYDKIYADSRKWLQQGWVDYFTPQLYWPVAEEAQSYPVLMQWWIEQNAFKRHIWPGNYTSRIGAEEETWEPSEILEQLQITRGDPRTTGNVHFSMNVLMDNPSDVSGALMKEYDEPALVPATFWLNGDPPPMPRADIQQVGNRRVVSLNPGPGSEPWLWVVKAKYGRKWVTHIQPGWKQSLNLETSNKQGWLHGVAVTTVNRLGQESAVNVVEVED